MADRNRRRPPGVSAMADTAPPTPAQVYSDAVWSVGPDVLSTTEKMAALCYADHARKHDRAWVTARRLMQACSFKSESTAVDVVRRLVRKQWLAKVGPRPGHRQIIVYRLTIPHDVTAAIAATVGHEAETVAIAATLRPQTVAAAEQTVATAGETVAIPGETVAGIATDSLRLSEDSPKDSGRASLPAVAAAPNGAPPAGDSEPVPDARAVAREAAMRALARSRVSKRGAA